jgi:hypothetical protein
MHVRRTPLLMHVRHRYAYKSCCLIVAVSRDSATTKLHDSNVPIALRGPRMLQVFRSGLSRHPTRLWRNSSWRIGADTVFATLLRVHVVKQIFRTGR